MPSEVFVNGTPSGVAQTTINGAVLATDTSLTLVDATWVPIAYRGGQFRILVGSERILVQYATSTTFTVVGGLTGRGIEDTTAATHSIGDGVFPILTAGGLASLVPAASYTAVTGGVGFQNGWADYGGTWQSVGFLKDAMGFVHLQGVMTGGANAVPAFTLPIGLRPAIHCLGIVRDGASNTGMQTVEINADGTVVMLGGASNAFVPLDCITFLAGA